MKLRLAKTIKKNWVLNKKAPLESKYRWGKVKGIISFIYCPSTGEFSLGRAERHKSLAQAFKTPLDRFVRGIYLKKEGKIILRAYAIDKIENYENQWDTIEALGLEGKKLKLNASREELYYQYDWK